MSPLLPLRRLLDDDPKEAWEILVATVLSLVLLGLIALLLWPADKMAVAVRLFWGYGVFWPVVALIAVATTFIQRRLRVDMHSHFDAYVLSNLAVSVFLSVGWSAFAAITVRSFVAGTSLRIAAILYFAGFLSSLIGFLEVSSFYQGHIYKLINLPLAIVSFIVFAVWPAGGRVMYGWFFDLF